MNRQLGGKGAADAGDASALSLLVHAADAQHQRPQSKGAQGDGRKPEGKSEQRQTGLATRGDRTVLLPFFRFCAGAAVLRYKVRTPGFACGPPRMSVCLCVYLCRFVSLDRSFLLWLLCVCVCMCMSVSMAMVMCVSRCVCDGSVMTLVVVVVVLSSMSRPEKEHTEPTRGGRKNGAATAIGHDHHKQHTIAGKFSGTVFGTQYYSLRENVHRPTTTNHNKQPDTQKSHDVLSSFRLSRPVMLAFFCQLGLSENAPTFTHTRHSDVTLAVFPHRVSCPPSFFVAISP